MNACISSSYSSHGLYYFRAHYFCSVLCMWPYVQKIRGESVWKIKVALEIIYFLKLKYVW